MGSLIFVDCESRGPCPSCGKLTAIGAVEYLTRGMLHIDEKDLANEAWCYTLFEVWLKQYVPPYIFVSDNPAYDWQWINDGFHRTLGRNPFGHSARRIGDFYAGLVDDWWAASRWKRLRRTPHDHDPVHDATGNVEAFERMLRGERA